MSTIKMVAFWLACFWIPALLLAGYLLFPRRSRLDQLLATQTMSHSQPTDARTIDVI